MNCKLWLFSAITLLASSLALAQPLEPPQSTLSGYIHDTETHEALIGATVRVVGQAGVGVVTNVYGFYSLTLPPGNYTFEAHYVGFETNSFTVDLHESVRHDVDLAPKGQQLEEVVVLNAYRPEDNVEGIKMSRESLQIERLKALPALLGEVDVMRSVQLLPGVTSGGEGSTGLFVRGGSADQNLVMLDEATVYNPSHVLGFFSVFSPDAVKNLDLYKGGIPAKFGGRASSVLDVHLKDGNKKNFVANGGIGLISSRLSLEGPLVKEKASFIVSARRTYADAVVHAIPTRIIDPLTKQAPQVLKTNNMFFYDLTAKASMVLNDHNRVFVSSYMGRDRMTSADLFGFDWGNRTLTTRWSHIFNDQMFIDVSYIQSDYDYGVDILVPGQETNWSSGLREKGGKFDLNWFATPSSTIDVGGSVLFHSFLPGTVSSSVTHPTARTATLQDRHAREYSIYVANDHKINEWLSLQYGLRWSAFDNVGTGTVRSYHEGAPRHDSTVLETLSFGKGELIQRYQGLEPRLSARALLDHNSSLKASYNRTRQYMQLASNSSTGLPIDRWIPADRYLKPIIADQVAMGYFHNFAGNRVEGLVEVYYKWMQNVIDFRPGASLLSDFLETEIYEGSGWAYGVEFELKKNVGKTTGWVSYTLSKSRRQVDGLNGGLAYNARNDRTHDISLVFTHKLSPQWSISGNWVYATSQAVSLPEGSYQLNGQTVPYYNPLKYNAYRLPDYHRADLSATWNPKPHRNGQRWEHHWNFGIYNLYGRQNIFMLEFRNIYNNDPSIYTPPANTTSVRPGVRRTFLFSMIPSVTYNFTFK